MRGRIPQLVVVLLAALLVAAQQPCSELNVKVTKVCITFIFIWCFRGILVFHKWWGGGVMIREQSN